MFINFEKQNSSQNETIGKQKHFATPPQGSWKYMRKPHTTTINPSNAINLTQFAACKTLNTSSCKWDEYNVLQSNKCLIDLYIFKFLNLQETWKYIFHFSEISYNKKRNAICACEGRNPWEGHRAPSSTALPWRTNNCSLVDNFKFWNSSKR